MNAASFQDQAGPTRRAALAALQTGKKSRRIIRRALLALVVSFAAVFLLAYFNPVLHKGAVVTACAGSAT